MQRAPLPDLVRSLEWAALEKACVTDQQKRICRIVFDGKSAREAARQIGMDYPNLRKSLAGVYNRASQGLDWNWRVRKGDANKATISRDVRFTILERDGFKCGYCGAKAPGVELEVDHILPVSQGGTSDPSNLKTACWDCNQGKGDRVLKCGS